jgi:chitodextrinase
MFKKKKPEDEISDFKIGKGKKIQAATFMLLFALIGTTTIYFGRASSQVVSVKAGSWNDASVWSTGKVPTENELVVVKGGHNVILSGETPKLGGVKVEANSILEFDKSKSTRLLTSENIVVEGSLVMKPSSPDVDHLIKFLDINEEAYVGGGHDPIDTDVGLWVMYEGKLDAVGAKKLGWTNLAGSVSRGANKVQLNSEPEGWRVGDEISIAPTAPGHDTHFDLGKITAINGQELTLESALAYDHPAVSVSSSKTKTAEVINLTRNVRIEGEKPEYKYPRDDKRNTQKGRSHIMIRNTSPVVQNIKYVDIRYMGPRQANPSRANSVNVMGRYALHFHMSEENNRGTVVEGTVIRDTDSHAYVPHRSHGITFYDTVAYNVSETPYWWDVRSNEQAHITNDITHDTLYDRTIAALANIDFRGDTRLAGYSLAIGRRNEIKNSVAVGIVGRVQASGFLWPEGANGNGEKYNVWRFNKNNIAHNNSISGLFSWQNDPDLHIINDFVAYHNGCSGIDHGAYKNAFVYQNITLYRNNTKNCSRQTGDVFVHATNRGSDNQNFMPIIFSEIDIDATGSHALSITKHSLPNPLNNPVRLQNWNVRGFTDKAVQIREVADGHRGEFDLVCWTLPGNRELEPSDFRVDSMAPESVIRVQQKNGTAYQVLPNGTTRTIEPFVAGCPQSYPLPGNGDGLVGKYYSDLTFSELFTTRKDPTIDFYWRVENEVMPGLPGDNFSVIWTGKLRPDYSEPYIFYSFSRRQMKVYIDNQLVLDNSMPTFTTWQRASQPVQLTAGKKHDLRIEFTGGGREAKLSWSSPTQPLMHIGEAHLYSGEESDVGSEPVQEPDPDTPPPEEQVDTIPPTTPAGLSAENVTHDSVTLNWIPSNDNVGVEGYEVLRNGNVVTTTQTTSYRDSELTPSTEYSYRIRAFDAADNKSELSSALIVTTQSAPDTEEPVVEITNPGTGAIVSGIVNVTAAATDNRGVARVEFLINDEIVYVDQIAPYVFVWDTTLIENEIYRIVAIAYDEAGNAGLSQTVNVTVDNSSQEDNEAPTAPSALEATAVEHNRVNLQWSPSTDNVAVAGYNVYRNGRLLAITTATIYSDRTVVEDTSYSYHIVAFDTSDNLSDRSNQLDVLTPSSPDTQSPTAPDLSAQSKSSSIVLNWSASTDNVGVAGYYVQRDGVTIATVNSTSYTDADIVVGSTYNYRVVAFDAAGNYGLSNVVTVEFEGDVSTDNEPPTVPANLRETFSHTRNIDMEWDRSSDNVRVSGYRVYRDGQPVADVSGVATTSFGDYTVRPNTGYKYNVKAIDGSGNESELSNNLNSFSHRRR